MVVEDGYSSGRDPVASALAQFDHFSCTSGNNQAVSSTGDEIAQRIYLVAGPIIIMLGLCGNFAIIAILSKPRFHPFPLTTLIKSHAIANIFCLFLGLFLGDYFRVLANFDLQTQFGTWGCRFHLTLSYALRYVTAWHYVMISGFRLLMGVAPSFYTSHSARRLVRGAIAFILVLVLLLAGYIAWSMATSQSTKEPQLAAVANASQTNCRLSCAQIFYDNWRIIDLTLAVIAPLILVFISTTTLPLILKFRRVRSQNVLLAQGSLPESHANSKHHPTVTIKSDSVASDLIASAKLTPSMSRSAASRRRSTASIIEVMSLNLSAMLYYQDVVFMFLTVPLLVYFLLLYFPPVALNNSNQVMSMMIILQGLYPFANLLQYATNVAQFPIYALSNKSTRRPKPKNRKKKKQDSCFSGSTATSQSKSMVSPCTHGKDLSLQMMNTAVSTSEEALQSSPAAAVDEPQHVLSHSQQMYYTQFGCSENFTSSSTSDLDEIGRCASGCGRDLRPDDVDRFVAALTGDSFGEV